MVNIPTFNVAKYTIHGYYGYHIYTLFGVLRCFKNSRPFTLQLSKRTQIHWWDASWGRLPQVHQKTPSRRQRCLKRQSTEIPRLPAPPQEGEKKLRKRSEKSTKVLRSTEHQVLKNLTFVHLEQTLD